ncbi:uroporphyrinogen-III synthase [Alicyclobacillus tolerans]|uniref:uroporphyrinogen-III synthase n=1 Tax=Alicyclobacillus tolerans TaxID=90970 RepID=UPI001EFF8630|nr:uroporphyrinogen-III synthase [Alicyclobacillus tolerans]MCF8567409.1 uroporphyrinogen-III synthase [Alicyclobacillus tolerans]
MDGLKGKTVVLTGTRKTDELVTLVEKLGGTALLRPLQVKMQLDEDEVLAEMRKLLTCSFDWVIFTTAAGAERLHQAAQSLGLESQFLEMLHRVSVAARGYKTIEYIKSIGIVPTVRDEDGTTASLLAGMERKGLTGKTVALQLYGEPAPSLISMFRDRGSHVQEIEPYRNMPPETSTMQMLISEILEERVDAVTFTSTTQIRFLMEYARVQQCKEALITAFSRTVPVAVGKVTAEALKNEGVTTVIWPKTERMGSMIITLARFFTQRDGSCAKGTSL